MTNINTKYFIRYLVGTMAYGLVRKVDELTNACLHVRDYDDKTRQSFDRPVPMLYTDRAFVLAVSTFTAPYLWPIYLFNDLSDLELRIRKANPADYGKKDIKRYVFDYLF